MLVSIKYGRMVTYNEENSSIMSQESLITWSHKVMWQIKTKYLLFYKAAATKLDRLVTINEENSSIISANPLIT